MAIRVQKHFFRDRTEVLNDLKVSGYWPTTFVSGPSPGLEVHWHAEEVHAYVLEGNTTLLDSHSGERYEVGPGDKITVQPRTLHAEGEVIDRVVYIIAVPEAVFPEEFLKQRPPDEL